MRVIYLFSNLHAQNFRWLNSANIALLPKKDGAEQLTDFRPISLIHGVAKIIAKMMSLRLSPFMDTLISKSQSAFIKTRSIHDNFLNVRSFTRRLHRTKTPTVFLKLDIKKAFDSVRWDYLLDLMQRCGFPSRYRNWVTALLITSSSRVLLNGVPGAPIVHGRGLRQGDPLSPLLFDLAIDPLQQLLDLATTNGDLHRLRGRGPSIRTSLYADDAAIFIAPFREDFVALAHILEGFGEVTGLVTNMHKSIAVPIRCSALDLDDIMQGFPIRRTNFPIKYLGLPLSTRGLKGVDVQPLVDKVTSKLVPWEGKTIAAAGWDGQTIEGAMQS
jgi:mannosylglycoprotein endo-beta-mannosidase